MQQISYYKYWMRWNFKLFEPNYTAILDQNLTSANIFTSSDSLPTISNRFGHFPAIILITHLLSTIDIINTDSACYENKRRVRIESGCQHTVIYIHRYLDMLACVCGRDKRRKERSYCGFRRQWKYILNIKTKNDFSFFSHCSVMHIVT